MKKLLSSLKRIILIISLCISYAIGISQTQIELPGTLPGNIIGGGASILETIHANGFLFIYSSDGIIVFNENSNQFIHKIPFNENMDFGKFSPAYFNDRLGFGDGSLMAYNDNLKTLYVVFPDLEIKCISVISPLFGVTSFNPFDHQVPSNSDNLPSYFKPLHNACLIKYDHVHHRLFWLIFAKDPQANCTGNFHYLSRFFAILDVNPLGDLTWYYTELLEQGNSYIDRAISDIEYNEVESSQLFYLSKLNKIEIWAITGNHQIILLYTVMVDATIYHDESGGSGYYKFGKMLYIHNSGIHQIIALPYRFPSSVLNEGKVPLVYVIDGNWNGTGEPQVTTFESPSEKVSDGIFIGGLNHLILGYADDPDVHHPSGKDISVYTSGVQNSYSLLSSLGTDNSIKISNNDINTSFKLVEIPSIPPDPPALFVGKKDGICKLVYTGIYPAYYSKSYPLNAESNFFKTGVKGNSNFYFVNAVLNGISVFNNNSFITSIPTAYPVYSITGNSDGSKLFFFNTLQANNTGLYIYSNNGSININNDPYPNNNIVKAIGDCKFNPFKNQFLVSECADFGQNPAIIRVINADAANSWVQDIQLTDGKNNYQYPKEMFITPDGRLYVMANMHDNESNERKLLEFIAFDHGQMPAYSLLNTYTISMPAYTDQFEFYSSHFAYDSRDQSVYVTVHPTELTLDPYRTVVNSMYDFDPPTDNPSPTGSIACIKNGVLCQSPQNYPGEIICPGAEYPGIPTKFDGKIYIIGKQFFEMDIENCLVISSSAERFNDITYCPYYDKLFAIRDVSADPIQCANQRRCDIYQIDRQAGNLSFTLMGSVPGQVSSIHYNPYDGKVYLYYKIDDTKLGTVPVQIWTFDPAATAGNLQFTSIELPYMGLAPELDHDPDHHYYMYNITEPYIDPVHNYIYYPNGGRSSVSRIEFQPDETVPLDGSLITWMSFPRLDRASGNPTVNAVLGGYNIDPSNYYAGSTLNNLPPQHVNEISNLYDGLIWPGSEELKDIDSRYGYKLQLKYDPENLPEKEWLHLYGDVIDAATPLTVYGRYDNWVGYWLYDKQSPFSAFSAQVLDKLDAIVAQHWICGKYRQSYGPGGPEPSYWLCACHEGKVELGYGDMVILKPEDGIEDFSFQWLRYGNAVVGRERPSVEHFQFTEQADYIPYIIELDSTLLPDEIGAFVNDTCVGATRILSGDTLVLVPGYTEGMNGEVTFELYFDSLKSSPQTIPEYWVENPRTSRKDYRTLYTSEKENYFIISFRKNEHEASIQNDPEIQVTPNPSKDKWIITYILPENGNVSIEIFDLCGKKLKVLSEGYLPAGIHQSEIRKSDLGGKEISEGLYLVRLHCGEYTAVTKLIFLK